MSIAEDNAHSGLAPPSTMRLLVVNFRLQLLHRLNWTFPLTSFRYPLAIVCVEEQ